MFAQKLSLFLALSFILQFVTAQDIGTGTIGCDIESWKESCITDETQSCSFVLYNSEKCKAECLCRPKTNEEYTMFCDVESSRNDCENVENAICTFEVLNAANCDLGCSCVSADPPVFCDIEAWKDSCINDETQSCSFVLYNSEKCEAECLCRPKTNEEYTMFCDVESFRNDCENVENAICTFEVLNAANCELGCSCVSADPPSICDIDAWKDSCINDETQSCTFTLFSTQNCDASCDCQPKTSEAYIQFCDIEQQLKACVRPCFADISDVAACKVDCICEEPIAVDPECPTECPVNDQMICTKYDTPGDRCPFECGCVSANPPFITCDEYLAPEKAVCEAGSSGSTLCEYLVNQEECSGECHCHKRQKCFPV